ncbi:MAG: HDIG domain-containing protein [Bacteroidales bacterium]|nr:HDIG domain-containing protein [Bacteroidales bacterium]
MNPLKIIEKFYKKDSNSYYYLVEHSKSVAKKALEVANKVPHLNPDLKFIEEAALLHDIGVFLTYAPKIECFGDRHYVEHGFLGAQILEKEGYPRHALVCENHVGVGLTIEDIRKLELQIPLRNMEPKTIEEEIICFADKFFSKKDKYLNTEKSIPKIIKGLSKFGESKVVIFEKWIDKFGY